MSGSKHKSSGDVAGTGKKCQAITVETKVIIIERVERGEKMADVARSCNKNRSTTSTILKNKDKIMEREVCCADVVDSNIKEAWKSDGGDAVTSQYVDAGSGSSSSPAQLNADSREAKSLYEDLKKKHGKESEGTSLFFVFF